MHDTDPNSIGNFHMKLYFDGISPDAAKTRFNLLPIYVHEMATDTCLTENQGGTSSDCSFLS